MKRKVMTLAVAAAIALVTAVGTRAAPPIDEDTASLLRAAVKLYDEYTETFDDALQILPTGNHYLLTNPTVMKYAPAEAKAAQKATDAANESTRRSGRALEALADKFRKLAPRRIKK